MMRRCLLALLLLGALPARADLVEADAAFDAGDHARALALYDEVLRETPMRSRRWSARGCSCPGTRSTPRRSRATTTCCAVEPGHAQASLERAKVLSWSGKNAEAAEAFRALLVRDSQNREARLGLARSLAWAGRQQDARHEYAILLERNPADAEALVGMAQTHAWSGDLVNARRLYEQALASTPEQRDALLGLAYVDLWAGDRGAADSMGLKLDARYPGDPEVAELRREVSKSGNPWVSGYATSLDDTDDHRMDTLRLETGFGFRLFDLGVGVVRYDLEHPVEGDSTIQGIYETASFRPTSRQRVSLRLGAERLESPGGERDTLMLGGLSWTYGIGGLWQLTAGFDHDPYRYSTAILVNKVTVDDFRLRADATPWPAWRLGGGFARGELDALGPGTENTRDGFDVGAWYRHPFGRITGEAGYIYRFLDYAQDLDLGYFDPQDFTSHLLQVRAFGPLLQTKAYWDVTLEGGCSRSTSPGPTSRTTRCWAGRRCWGIP